MRKSVSANLIFNYLQKSLYIYVKVHDICDD